MYNIYKITRLYTAVFLHLFLQYLKAGSFFE